jgi:hypothetical protein
LFHPQSVGTQNQQPLQSNGLWGCTHQLIVTALAIVICSTGEVAASCGDYLFKNGQRVEQHSISASSHIEFQMLSNEMANKSSNPVSHRCAGPNCSRSNDPLFPIESLPASEIRRTDQAAVIEAMRHRFPAVIARDIPTSECGAFFEPGSIFRPPPAD